MAQNRMIRNWNDSEKVNALSVYAERFFTRLIMEADDFGCYTANPKLLKAALFPLLDEVRQTDITRWTEECQKAGLILLYEVDGKPYMQILNFGQRVRHKKKYPHPEDGRSQTAAKSQPHEKKEIEKEENEKKSTLVQSLREQFFIDLPNSEKLVRAAADLGVDLDAMKSKIPEFRKGARSEYKNFADFVDHFKYWYRKLMVTKRDEQTAQKGPKKKGS